MPFEKGRTADSLGNAYERGLTDGYVDDPIQRHALTNLARVADDLYAEHMISQKILLVLRRVVGSSPPPHRGLYLWGGVGRGKTYLMDLFFDWIPEKRKKRMHFHRFMSFVHSRLTELRGRPSPLRIVASEFARDTRLLCFDEFFVSDIGDAMILSELLAGLFEQRVFLVATSNTHPDDLYADGLHRDRFLPAIHLMNRHLEAHELSGNTDYRLATLSRQKLYRLTYPASDQDVQADQSLLVPHESIQTSPLTILDREIRTVFHTNGVVAFRFEDLCQSPRHVDDYIEIASLFHTVVIYDIPTLTPTLENAARRFIALVDEFYERKVNTVFSAQQPLESLYQSPQLINEFERTKSRIFEMQSEQYLSQPHRP